MENTVPTPWDSTSHGQSEVLIGTYSNIYELSFMTDLFHQVSIFYGPSGIIIPLFIAPRVLPHSRQFTGNIPPSILTYLHSSTNIEALDTRLTTKEEIFNLLYNNLSKAQKAMKDQADKHRSQVEL